MLMDAVDDLWPQLAAKRISIETIGEDDRLIVRGERSLLTRALTNVIGNAIKFSEEDTQIRCTLARVSSEDGAELASCAIADDGHGLTPDHQQKIYDGLQGGQMGIGRRVDGEGRGLRFAKNDMVESEVRRVWEEVVSTGR